MNFLLIITDQQRCDHIGAYGNPVVRTPNIDALAMRGWAAERFYVASPACMPNRASLMTGRLPSLHGVRHNGIPLPLTATTFVEMLSAAGWQTALAGKSHLQNMSGLRSVWPPLEQRFGREAHSEIPGNYRQEWGPDWRSDKFELDLPYYGFQGVSLAVDHGDVVGGHYWRWLKEKHPDVAAVAGPEHAIPSPEYRLTASQQAWRTRVPEECSTTSWVANETIGHLRRFSKSTLPFFLQCSFPDPHHPFTPPGRFWDMYKPEDIELPPSFHASIDPPPQVAWLRSQRDTNIAVKRTPAAFACDEREAREAIALNYGSITHIDDAIGRVVSALRDLGMADDTVVIFTSDHGDYLGDHQLLLKGPIHYQSLVRTPFIWVDPAAPVGRRSDALWSTIDIAPSILQRAGVTAYNGIQGRLLECVEGGAEQPRRESVLIEDEVQRVLFGFDSPPKVRTLVTGRWRLTLYANATWGELYDLQTDAQECHNLWDDAAHAGVRSDLTAELVRQIAQHSESSPYPSALA